MYEASITAVLMTHMTANKCRPSDADNPSHRSCIKPIKAGSAGLKPKGSQLRFVFMSDTEMFADCDTYGGDQV
jgi:hypothetical protein